MSEPLLILFDGVCNLCNRYVNIIIRHDSRRRFRFSPMQSPAGQAVMKRLGIAIDSSDTMILVENDRFYTRSTAGLRIARELSGLWPLLYAFIIIPRPLRDAIYNGIARNRYRWFGRRDACMVPSPDTKDRFLV